MKNFREVAVFLMTNVSIGIAAIVAIIGFVVGVLYITELVEKLFTQIIPSTVQLALSVGISSILAFYLLAIFGFWVREKIEDVIWKVRSQRQTSL